MIFAGVLLYFIHQHKYYFLLGRELTGELNPFGGGPKSSDMVTEAAREFEEETMGIFGSAESMISQIALSDCYQTSDVTIFFCRIDATVEQIVTLQHAFKNVYHHFSKCTVTQPLIPRGTYLEPCVTCPEGYLEMTELVIVPRLSVERYPLRGAFRDQLSELLPLFDRLVIG
jgi:hypothetical protein